MVLRSGIIIPFQFRDTKKLLMIGVPQENRDLNIWDLKNVGKHWSGWRVGGGPKHGAPKRFGRQK